MRARFGRTRTGLWAVTTATIAVLAVAGCGDSDSDTSGTPEEAGSGATSSQTDSQAGSALPQGSEPVDLDPADFSTDIDNRWWPMAPGNRWVYRETDTTGAEQKVVVEVTDETKQVANGIEARVVRDTVTEDGEPVEVTDDWYAQDSSGNIWYLGEDTAEYEDGEVVNRSGSFEAGVDGAQPGIIMPGDPMPGMEYRQEYYEGEAEDEAAVVTRGQEQVEVPYGFFDSEVVMTRDLVPTEPRVQELKFYAPGVGPVLAVHTDGDGGREELLSFRQGG